MNRPRMGRRRVGVARRPVIASGRRAGCASGQAWLTPARHTLVNTGGGRLVPLIVVKDMPAREGIEARLAPEALSAVHCPKDASLRRQS